MILEHNSISQFRKQLLPKLYAMQSFFIRKVVDAHLYDHFGVPDMMELSNHSLSSFKRKFKEIYGERPAAYIKKEKLKKAVELLLSSGENVNKICFDSDFNSQAHFSRSFKNEFGLSISEFRMNHLVR